MLKAADVGCSFTVHVGNAYEHGFTPCMWTVQKVAAAEVRYSF